jgi:hypothetical protein
VVSTARTKAVLHSAGSPMRRKMQFSCTASLGSALILVSFSEMLGTILFLPSSVTPASNQPVTTSSTRTNLSRGAVGPPQEGANRVRRIKGARRDMGTLCIDDCRLTIVDYGLGRASGQIPALGRACRIRQSSICNRQYSRASTLAKASSRVSLPARKAPRSAPLMRSTIVDTS